MTAGKEINIPILIYHDIRSGSQPETPLSLGVELLEQQLDLLVKFGYTTITFDHLARALVGEVSLPKKPVILSFDDGYVSFHDLVTPMCVAREMTATVFILAGGIGGSNHWDAALGYPEVALMSEAQINRVAAAGMELGVHGWCHRRLMESDDSERREEIIHSKAALEARFNRRFSSYCYAFGKHSAELFPLLREAGYDVAVAIETAGRKTTSEPLAMRRIHIHEKDTGLRFLLKITSFYQRYLAARQTT